MTDYSIQLPKRVVVQNVNYLCSPFDRNKNWDYGKALSAFDTNGDGLTYDELMQAYDYFTKKEREVAVFGEKADGVITSQDIEQIIKTDTKFDVIRKKYNDDSKVTQLLTKIVLILSAMVEATNQTPWENSESLGLLFTGANYFDLIGGPGKRLPKSIYNDASYKTSELKEICGIQYRAWSSVNGRDLFVTSPDGKYVCDDPGIVAKAHGCNVERKGLFNNKKVYTKKQKHMGSKWDYEDTYEWQGNKLKRINSRDISIYREPVGFVVR